MSRNRLIGVNQSHSKHVRNDSSHIFVVEDTVCVCVCVGGKLADFLIYTNALIEWLFYSSIWFCAQNVSQSKTESEWRGKEDDRKIVLCEKNICLSSNEQFIRLLVTNHTWHEWIIIVGSRCGQLIVIPKVNICLLEQYFANWEKHAAYQTGIYRFHATPKPDDFTWFQCSHFDWWILPSLLRESRKKFY